jgi:type IV secretion system protein TrbL
VLDSTVLTDILGAFVNGSSQGFPLIKGYAEGIFAKLIIIEVVLFGIGVALNRIDFKAEIVAKVLAIGFAQFLIFRYVWLVDGIRDGFVNAGLASGGGHLNTAEFLDPSAYISSGFDKVFSVLEGRFNDGAWHFLSTFSMVGLFNLIILLLMFFAFIAMGFQIFFAVIEFYIVTSLAIILIPFLIVQKTSFLGFRAINGILSNCIKLMVLAFIASLASPVLQELTFSTNEPTLRESMSLAVGALAIALLMWRAPSIAMSFIAGTSGLDFNSSALQPALTAANGASGLSRLASGAASAGGSALRSVAQAARQGANRVSNLIK